MQKVLLDIDGMRCSMCESHVCDAVRKALPEAKKVKASASRGEVSFLLEDNVSYEAAVKEIECGGYHVLHTYSEPYEKKKFLFF